MLSVFAFRRNNVNMYVKGGFSLQIILYLNECRYCTGKSGVRMFGIIKAILHNHAPFWPPFLCAWRVQPGV